MHDSLPDMTVLLAAGHKKQKLRAHSDYYPNSAANNWALSFWDTADIMSESKCKNLASIELYKFWKGQEEPVCAILKLETQL
jgi:UV DNA damage endonuclease